MEFNVKEGVDPIPTFFGDHTQLHPTSLPILGRRSGHPYPRLKVTKVYLAEYTLPPLISFPYLRFFLLINERMYLD